MKKITTLLLIILAMLVPTTASATATDQVIVTADSQETAPAVIDSIIAYFSTIATSALTVIQNTAPMPPNDNAVATPTMFPTPSVPANAISNAFTGDMPPPCLFLSRGDRVRHGCRR